MDEETKKVSIQRKSDTFWDDLGLKFSTPSVEDYNDIVKIFLQEFIPGNCYNFIAKYCQEEFGILSKNRTPNLVCLQLNSWRPWCESLPHQVFYDVKML